MPRIIKGLSELLTVLGCKNKVPWIVMSVVLALPQTVFACAACTGRSDDAAAHGLNAAVFTLLLVLLAVYGAIGSCLTYFIRRAAKHPMTLPEVQEGPFAANSRATVNRVAPILSSLDSQTPLKRRKEWYEDGRN